MASGGRRESRQKCHFFGSKAGCWHGDDCRFRHDVSNPGSQPVCRFYNSSVGCKNGLSCRFSHSLPEEKPSTALKETKQEEGAKKPLGESNPLADSANQAVGENKKAEGVNEKKKKNKKKKKKGKKGQKNKENKPSVLHCGYCDQMTVTNNPAGHETLKKHLKDKISEQDKAHTALFRHEDWGEDGCECIVCEAEFTTPLDLLAHLDKNYDEVPKPGTVSHKQLMMDIMQDLIEGDMEGDSDEFLIDQMKDMFGMESDMNYMDSDDSEDYGFSDRINYMIKRAQMCETAEEFEEEVEERAGNMFGMLDDEVEELLCQGIKPWDSEAFAALDVLYDF